MARSAPKVCSNTSCVKMAVRNGRCADCEKKTEALRPEVYGSGWKRLARRVRSEEPLCVRCKQNGKMKATEVADHIVPVWAGGLNERSNLQGLCRRCNMEKSIEDAEKFIVVNAGSRIPGGF